MIHNTKKLTLIFFLMIALNTSCVPEEITVEDTKKTSIPVYVEQVKIKDLEKHIKITGIALPKVQIPITAPKGTTIEEWHIKDGDFVQQDNPIFSINDSQLKKLVENSKKQINELELALQETKSYKETMDDLQHTQEKTKQLLESYNLGIFTDVELVKNSLDIRLQQAELMFTANNTMHSELQAKLKEAKRQLTEAEGLLKQTTIRAPFNGYISIANEFPAIANTNEPIARLINLDEMEALFQVNSYQIADIQENMSASLEFDGIPSIYESTIKSVSPISNKNTNMYTIKVPIENKSHLIKGGMRTTASIPIHVSKQATVVSVDSVLYDKDQAYIFVIENKKAKRINVELGIENNGLVEVKTKLVPNQVVVTKGKEALTDGVPTMIRKE